MKSSLSSHQKLLQKTAPDDIFLVSYPKSGTTWMRFLIGNYLTGNQCNFSNAHSIMPGLRHDQDTVNWCQFKPRFIQSHFPFSPEYHKVVYLVRDGRDVAVSFYFHLLKHWRLKKDTLFADYLTKFNQGSLGISGSWGDHVLTWLDNAPSEFILVRYEDIHADASRELTRVLEFAGLSVCQQAVNSAVEASNFGRMQSLEKNQYQLSQSNLATSDPSIQFVRKGEIGDWQNYFTDELLSEFINKQGKALQRLGYLDKQEGKSFLIRNNSAVTVKETLPSFNLSELKNKPNIILTGLPRSGTTLSCHLLNKLPNFVALNEPIIRLKDIKNLNDSARLNYIIELFATARGEILNQQQLSLNVAQIDGKIPTDSFTQELDKNGFRKRLANDEQISIDKKLTSDFLLAIKKPALFTAILETLVEDFPAYAVVRNPLSILTSWNTIRVIQDPQWVKMGLDRNLTTAMEKIKKPLDRQIYLLSWYYEKYQRWLPSSSILRYEDIVATGGRALVAITSQADNLQEELQNKNLNKVYDRELILRLGEKLLNSEGAFWNFYTKESVEGLLKACSCHQSKSKIRQKLVLSVPSVKQLLQKPIEQMKTKLSSLIKP